MRQATKDNLVVLGMMTAMVIVAVVVVYMPQGRTLDDLWGQIGRRRAALESDAERTSVVPQMIQTVEKMRKRYRNFDRRLPNSTELGPFLTEISANLAEERISDDSMDTQSPTREALFHTLPIVMKFKGSYLSLASFLRRIEGMERLARVQKLRMTADETGKNHPGDLNVELQINIYFTES